MLLAPAAGPPGLWRVAAWHDGAGGIGCTNRAAGSGNSNGSGQLQPVHHAAPRHTPVTAHCSQDQFGASSGVHVSTEPASQRVLVGHGHWQPGMGRAAVGRSAGPRGPHPRPSRCPHSPPSHQCCGSRPLDVSRATRPVETRGRSRRTQDSGGGVRGRAGRPPFRGQTQLVILSVALLRAGSATAGGPGGSWGEVKDGGGGKLVCSPHLGGESLDMELVGTLLLSVGREQSADWRSTVPLALGGTFKARSGSVRACRPSLGREGGSQRPLP